MSHTGKGAEAQQQAEEVGSPQQAREEGGYELARTGHRACSARQCRLLLYTEIS